MGRWSDFARALPAVAASRADSVISAERIEPAANVLPVGTNGTIGMTSQRNTPDRGWAKELALLAAMSKPQMVRPDRWGQMLRDAIAFTDRWGPIAFSLGWDAMSLFGCSPRFARRLDCDGLFWLLEGRVVVDVTLCTAVISTQSGGLLTYRPKWQSREAVLPWNAV